MINTREDYKGRAWTVVLICLGIGCLPLLVPSYLDMVTAAATSYSSYPGDSIETDYLLGGIWAAALGIGIQFWPVSATDKKALLNIWIIKVIVALVLMLLYEYRYAMDPDGYFGHATSDYFVWEGLHFGAGTINLHHFTWLHLNIVPDSYHAAKIGFAWIGLASIYIFYRAAVIYLGRESTRILYVLALFPSIIFWSSILGKDPIALLGMSLYAYGLVAWHAYRQPRHLVAFAAGILIASLIRIWLVPIMLAPLFAFIILGRGKLIRRFILTMVYFLAFAILLSLVGDMMDISAFGDLFDYRSYAVGGFAGGGSSLMPAQITSSIGALQFLPMGIFTALFRPLPGEVPNIYGFLQSLDNVALLLLLVAAVIRTRFKDLQDPFVLWAISLILIWASVYGLVAYNLGTLVRYKLQIFPILLGLLLYMSRRRRSEPLKPEKDHVS